MRRLFLWATLLIAVAGGAELAAQPLAPPEEAKTSRAVLERSQLGKSQDLIVIIDHAELVERAAKRREQRGPTVNENEVLEEWKRDAAEVRSRVFPGKHLNGAQVLEEWSYSTSVLVRVPDRRALESILRHPLVISVQERRGVPPA